jgi:hypothetical protein
MKLRKTITAVVLAAALNSPAFAAHIPGVSLSGEPFQVNPMAVGEPFPTFTAGALTFSYSAEMDQTGFTFAETGVADIGSFLEQLGGASIGAGTTGLNLGPGTTGYSLFISVTGSGTVGPNAGGGVDGTYTTFDLSFFVDRDNDSSVSCGAQGPPNETCALTDATPGDDSLVLAGTLIVGGFHMKPGIAQGDFDVQFLVTSNPVGFFTPATVPAGTEGEIAGVHSTLDGVTTPGAVYTDAIIRGSGDGVFDGQPGVSLPTPGSLFLVGLALLVAGFAYRPRKLRV